MLNNILNKLYDYDSKDYMPIYYDGVWVNKKQFVVYKLERGFIKFSDAFDRVRESLD